TVQSLLNSARNFGAWNGSGITSTSARNRPSRNATLGAMEATDFKAMHGASATFDGQTLDSTAVLVKYTYYGDTDFNGIVDFDDYINIDYGFNTHTNRWRYGDTDGNGVIDFDDYINIDLAFNTQTGAL